MGQRPFDFVGQQIGTARFNGEPLDAIGNQIGSGSAGRAKDRKPTSQRFQQHVTESLNNRRKYKEVGGAIRID
jgi:hypothetical protein